MKPKPAAPIPLPWKDFHKELASIVHLIDHPKAVKAAKPSGPGRRRKLLAPTRSILLQVYEQQIRWIDLYADWLAANNPDGPRLSRTEVIRAFLTALGRHVSTHRIGLTQEPTTIRTEADLATAIAAALATPRPRNAP